jgi:hypothetical protein
MSVVKASPSAAMVPTRHAIIARALIGAAFPRAFKAATSGRARDRPNRDFRTPIQSLRTAEFGSWLVPFENAPPRWCRQCGKYRPSGVATDPKIVPSVAGSQQVCGNRCQTRRALSPCERRSAGFVVCSVAAAMSACLVSSPPMVRADPVATTALVLKVVDGDTVAIVDSHGWPSPGSRAAVGVSWRPCVGGNASNNVGSVGVSIPTRYPDCGSPVSPSGMASRSASQCWGTV